VVWEEPPSVVRDLQLLDAEIDWINQVLENSEVFPAREETDTVGIGNIVRLKFIDEEEEETFDWAHPLMPLFLLETYHGFQRKVYLGSS